MININWKKLFSYFITLLIGIALGWFLRGKEEIIKEKIKIERTTDTITVTNEIEVKTPAKIIYLPTPHQDTHPQGGILPEPALEEVAHWDSSTADGFKADVNYFTKSKFFKNKFSIPIKTIENTEVVTKEVTITELPAYEFGAGVRFTYLEDQFKTLPFLSLAANNKFLILNYKIGIRALAEFNPGSVQFIPEAEAMLNIPFE